MAPEVAGPVEATAVLWRTINSQKTLPVPVVDMCNGNPPQIFSVMDTSLIHIAFAIRFFKDTKGNLQVSAHIDAAGP